MIDLSIIIPSSRVVTLAHVLRHLNNQSADGLEYEIIIIQESNSGFDNFSSLTYGTRYKILRQVLHHDCGATARDWGFAESTGRYVVFWDDDNIYYPHAAATMFAIANGHDIGVARVRHRGMIIPTMKSFKPGDIDTMCFCVRRELAAKVKWVDDGGRYNDYRYISKVASLAGGLPNFTNIIVGEHL